MTEPTTDEILFGGKDDTLLEALFGPKADLDWQRHLQPKVGDRVRSYDFPVNLPIERWRLCYVEGVVEAVGPVEDCPGAELTIRINARVWDGEPVRYLPKEPELQLATPSFLGVFKLKERT